MVTGLIRRAATLLGMSATPDPSIPELIGLTGAAKILDVPRTTVHYWARTGRIMSARLGGDGDWVFRRAHIEWVAERRRREQKRPGPQE